MVLLFTFKNRQAVSLVSSSKTKLSRKIQKKGLLLSGGLLYWRIRTYWYKYQAREGNKPDKVSLWKWSLGVIKVISSFLKNKQPNHLPKPPLPPKVSSAENSCPSQDPMFMVSGWLMIHKWQLMIRRPSLDYWKRSLCEWDIPKKRRYLSSWG